jgi:hypothetical protein
LLSDAAAPSPRTGRWAAGLAAGALVFLSAGSSGHVVTDPAGTTAAVLSMVDSAGGRIEVVRHWPGAPSDVEVFPFVPYFWDGCPGPGAIMMLVTGPGGVPPGTAQIAQALATHLPRDRPGRTELARIIGALRTPGDPAAETLKAAAPWVSDLGTYEKWGYAVFLFIHWQGLRCGVTLRAVPEGYGIPFVR